VGEPDQIWVVRTSPGLLSLLGVPARLGRTLNGRSEAGNIAVVSDRFWKRRLHADPNAIGRTLTLSNEIFTIIGVMPPSFEFPNSAVEVWVPFRITAAEPLSVDVVARIKPGLALSQIQSAMTVTARQLEHEQPVKQAKLRIEVSPLRETLQREYELTLILVVAAVVLVFLIACADVASLLLSRAMQRQKEMAIRAALGAGFWQVLRQLLAESLLLTVVASVCGIGMAHLVLLWLSKQIAALPVTLPYAQRAGIDGRALLFAMGLCLLTSLVCSLAPVFLSSRADLQTMLRGGGIIGASSHPARLFTFLIGCQTAFAVILLIGSGILGRSLIRLQQADHGIHPDHVLTMRVPIGSATQPRATGKYDTKARQMAYYHDLVERLQNVPGAQAAAIVNNLPLSNANSSIFLKGPYGHPMLTSTRTISPAYFSVMGIARVAGRSFSERDNADAPRVAIINEFLARQLFPNVNPIGQKLASPEGGSGSTVVGIVKDSPQLSYEQPPKGEVYLPYQQTIFGVFLSTIVVRTSGDPLALAGALRKEVWAVDPEQPIVKVEAMQDVIADSIWRPRFSAWLFSILGGVALLLTAGGIYAVITYTTRLRLREVGIRMSLGASAAHVMGAVMRRALFPLAIGLALGMAVALLLSRMLAGLLYEIEGSDPVTYYPLQFSY